MFSYSHVSTVKIDEFEKEKKIKENENTFIYMYIYAYIHICQKQMNKQTNRLTMYIHLTYTRR